MAPHKTNRGIVKILLIVAWSVCLLGIGFKWIDYEKVGFLKCDFGFVCEVLLLMFAVIAIESRF